MSTSQSNLLCHNYSVLTFVAAIDSHRENIIPMAATAEKLPGDTGSQGYGTV